LLRSRDGDRLIARPSFFQLDNTRKARARGEPWHLIVHEDLIVLSLHRSQEAGRAQPDGTGPDDARGRAA
jgi:modification methylase